MCPLSLNRHHCRRVTLRSIHSVQLPLMLTGKARSKKQERKKKVYVTLVYMLLFAVALRCCDMLWYSCKISFTDLLTCADNTCLLDVSLHRIIISINFPLIYVIWWALTHITRSYLCMNGWQRRAFPLVHRHTEARVTSQWGHKHTNISRTALRGHFMSVSPFHLSKSISYPHIIYTEM